jgi:DNA polymerase III sliding clamp (beta) subunit (PCNA family)
MKVNRSELLEALERVRPGLSSKEMIEQTTSFAFKGGRVMTYNDEISVSHPIKGLDIEGAVKAEELHKFLSKTKKDEIELEIVESEIQITAGKAKMGITLQEEIKLPLEELGEIKGWEKIPKNFVAALKFASFSCSQDANKPILTCLHIDGEIVESSDCFRLTRYKLQKKFPFSCLLPASAARDLIKYPITEVTSGQGWAHFKTEEGTVFSCRVFEGEFPNSGELFKVKGEEISFPASINNLLEKAQIFSKREFTLDEIVVITLSNKRIVINSKSDCGWFEEETQIKYSGEPISFLVHPSFLKDICSQSSTCIIGETIIKFVGENWEHLVAHCQKNEQ